MCIRIYIDRVNPRCVAPAGERNSIDRSYYEPRDNVLSRRLKLERSIPTCSARPQTSRQTGRALCAAPAKERKRYRALHYRQILLRITPPSSVVKCVWEVFVWRFGVLFLSCACVSVLGVLFSVGVCVCDLLILLPITRYRFNLVSSACRSLPTCTARPRISRQTATALCAAPVDTDETIPVGRARGYQSVNS